MKYTIDDIDVYILTHNRAFLLSETIQSVLNQTIRPHTITVLDNESVDNTEEVVKRYQNQGVKYVKTYTRHGNFFKAKEMASKKYIVRFHDDNLIHPQFFEKVLFVLNNVDNVNAVTANATVFVSTDRPDDPNLRPPAYSNPPYLSNGMVIITNFYDFAVHHMFSMVRKWSWIANIPFIVTKTELFKHYDHVYEKLAKADDIDFLKKCCYNGNYVCLSDKNCAFFRAHPNRDSASDENSLNIDQMVNLVSYYTQELSKTDDKEIWSCFFKFLSIQYNAETVKRRIFEKTPLNDFITILYDRRILPEFTKEIYSSFKNSFYEKDLSFIQKILCIKNFRKNGVKRKYLYLLGFRVRLWKVRQHLK